MIIEPPKIDKRTFSRLAETLLLMAPHYVPEWKAEDGDAGSALAKLHAFMTEIMITRLNQVPRKSLIAFLDMLGIRLVPAQPSRVPIVFKLAQGTTGDVLVPPRTQTTAGKTAEHDEVPFETEKYLQAVVSRLTELISIDPTTDSIYVHTSNIIDSKGNVKDSQDAFTLFSGTNQQEHSLYFGQKDLLNIKGPGEIRLSITVPPAPGNNGSDIVWEYWGEDKAKNVDRWIKLDVISDATDGLSGSGEIFLFKGLEGEIKEVKLEDIFSATGRVATKDAAIAGMKNRWIRARLASPLTGTACSKVLALDTVFLKTAPSGDVPIDAGFFNDVALDYTRKAPMEGRGEMSEIRPIRKLTNVYIFGSQPKLYDAFYIGNKEVLSKKGATIDLSFILQIYHTSSDLTAPNPVLAWEYWDGNGWQALTILNDDTNSFTEAGDGLIIEFIVPEGISETAVFGQKNYWIRARLIGGDYGMEEYKIDPATNVVNVTAKFKLPHVRDLTATYSYEESVAPDVCLTYNNLDFEDVTTQATTANAAFSPYVPLPDGEKACYMGFDKQLQGGPIDIYFDADELQYEEDAKPEIEWRFYNGQGWSSLDFLDETTGFVTPGLLELIGSTRFAAGAFFDENLYWLRGGLSKGTYQSLPHMKGVFPNATWAVQAQTVTNEIIGSSNGEPDQTFSFLKFPVMDGEVVRVMEVLSDEERQSIISTFGQNSIFEVTDPNGVVTETWVLWDEAIDFFYADDKSRQYIIDRATGSISFGNGVNGMIPPAGQNNIKAFSYRTGGGLSGNVKALEVKSLKSSVAGIDKVMNPVAADGGADTTTVDEMLGIGPAEISHRFRAVTAEDYEWLARIASRKVVRARCLPNRNSEGRSETGWVTVVIIPQSTGDRPFPSLLLKRIVGDYLVEHGMGAIAALRHIHVDGPTYTAIRISVDLFVTTMDEASVVVRLAKQKLADFLHPLTGGPEGRGWDFGRGVAFSDVCAILEGIEGVDHVENLIFQGFEGRDFVVIEPNSLIANGEHTVNARLNGGGL